jgi:hypothetical protein
MLRGRQKDVPHLAEWADPQRAKWAEAGKFSDVGGVLIHRGYMNQSSENLQPAPKKQVKGSDRLSESLVVNFLDGTTVSYDPDFLYEHRDDSGNHTLKDDPGGTDEVK